jgi:Zn finger protein HypA/HybF involved in hydrogenase expression
MTQGQLPTGWHAVKVDSRRKAFKTVHELSYLNKTINNEVNKIANRCLHCGTTLHWHLKTIQCPLYEKKDGESILNISKLLKLR